MATVTFIKNHSQSARALKIAVNYAGRDDKTRNKELLSGWNCTPQLAEQEFRATRDACRKVEGRWFYHYTQSFSPDENVTPEQAHELAKEFAARAWPESEVLIATHIDAPHLHTHFIVNAVCFESGMMLRQPPNTLQKLRAISDELCLAHGLSVLPPTRKNPSQKMSAREYRAAAKGESWKFQLMAAVDDCMKTARSREDFTEQMRDAGYEVRWEDSRANITYTTPTGKKCRDKKLHEEKYLKENMENEFRIRREIINAGIARAEQEAALLAAADEDHGGVSRSGGADWADGAAPHGAAQDERAALDAPDAGGYGETASDAGADAQDNAAPEETGWEEAREAFLIHLAEGWDVALGASPDAVMGMADRDPAGLVGMAGGASATPHREQPVAALLNGAVQVGREVELALDATPAYDATMRPEHIDRKRRRELQDKRIALGHKPDDHEDEQQWQQRM